MTFTERMAGHVREEDQKQASQVTMRETSTWRERLVQQCSCAAECHVNENMKKKKN